MFEIMNPLWSRSPSCMMKRTVPGCCSGLRKLATDPEAVRTEQTLAPYRLPQNGVQTLPTNFNWLARCPMSQRSCRSFQVSESVAGPTALHCECRLVGMVASVEYHDSTYAFAYGVLPSHRRMVRFTQSFAGQCLQIACCVLCAAHQVQAPGMRRAALPPHFRAAPNKPLLFVASFQMFSVCGFRSAVNRGSAIIIGAVTSL